MKGTPTVSHGLRRWCIDYVRSVSLEAKLEPPSRPSAWSTEEVGSFERPSPEEIRSLRPGRPAGVRVVGRAEKIPKPGALGEASARVALLHVFMHHELQAAELSAWAVARFPSAPAEFHSGLLRVLDDEARHARMYKERIEALGGSYGDHAVRDWFWQRARTCESEVQYVALMGLGFEGANLEHAERFEQLFEAAGDRESARLMRRIGTEEIAHVRFAARWFAKWTGAASTPDFDAWTAALPPPLTPAVLRGTPIARDRRARAGLSDAFIERLDGCENPSGSGSRSESPVSRKR